MSERKVGSVTYQEVGEEYFKQRGLRRHAGMWSLWALGVGAVKSRRMNVRGLDLRMVAAFALFFAFGILWSIVLGHFTPRQLGVFWPTYFMMIYTIVGLWVGPAFVAIGLGITALTLIGYFFVGAWFDLWMAVFNGGGLILGGLWMRRS